MEDRIREIWNYYLKAEAPISDQPYSVFYFYNGTRDKLRSLSELLKVFCTYENANDFDYIRHNQHNIDETEIKKYVSRIAEPYPAQLEAIYNAMNYPISVVQGPPGTGKTETILNMLSVIRQRDLQRHNAFPTTVAIVSTNNEALQNIIDKVKESKGKDAVFAALDGCLAKLGSKKNRLEFHRELKRKHSQNANWRDPFCDEANIRRIENLLAEYPMFTSTIHSLSRLSDNALAYQYDYVIMDEASQTSMTLGLIAMAHAKHLVVIGDDNQLAPIIDGSKTEIEAEIPPIYKEVEDKSFLSAVQTILTAFDKNDLKVTRLDHHYRCHPSIIGFCDDYVYDNKLVIETPDDKSFRMRAVWYEGDYCEKVFPLEEDEEESKQDKTKKDEEQDKLAEFDFTDEDEDEEPTDEETDKAEKEKKPPRKLIYNMKQISIFLDEELPRIVRTPEASVLVVAPFKEQIKRLGERLKKLKEEKNIDLKVEFSCNDPLVKAAYDNINFNYLTIHRAQGKGFDIVYMLTTEDYMQNSNRLPWCQKMRMMNVAVSRAKKEFCVISSARWIPVEILEKDREIIEKNKDIGSLDYYRSTEPVKYKDPEDQKGNMYFCKLFDYMLKNTSEEKDYGEYGFHKSGIKSVFDDVPCFRYNNNMGKACGFAPELIISRLLNKLCPQEEGYSVLEELPLCSLTRLDGKNVRLPESRFARMSAIDFVVVKKDKNGNRVRLILEVDGSYHREDKKQIENDEKKTRYIKALLGSENDEEINHIFLRLPTDGTTRNEQETIKKLVKESEMSVLTVTDDIISLHKKTTGLKRMVTDTVKLRVNAAYSFIKNTLENEKARGEVSELQNLANSTNYSKLANSRNYSNQENYVAPAYNTPISNANYICRYGTAYVFEYALMYSIVMRSYFREHESDPKLSVISFGCGNMTDALGMLYAKAALSIENKRYEKCELYYRGVDGQKWYTGEGVPPFVYCENCEPSDTDPYRSEIRRAFKEVSFVRGRIPEVLTSDLLNNNKGAKCNVIFFPKILNELKTVVNDMIAKLEKMVFDGDEYYICVSHSKRDAEKNGTMSVKKIVNAINQNREFDVCDDIVTMLGEEEYDALKRYWPAGEDLEEISVKSGGSALSNMLNDSNYKCSCFKSAQTKERGANYISQINKDFYPNRTVLTYYNTVLQPMVREALREKRITDSELRSPISRVSQICFQIIRLKRKS